MSLATDLAVLDHSDGSLLLIANAVNYDGTDDGWTTPGPTPSPDSTG
jgi:hypothetical protein